MLKDILNISEGYPTDDSIVSYETFNYLPVSGTQLNSAGQIVIRVENSDTFFHPSNSWLQFEGTVKHGETDFLKTDAITFINNGILNLFDNIRYLLSGQEIESIYHPAESSSMLGLLKYSKQYNDGVGLNSCWNVDTDEAKAEMTKNIGFKNRQFYLLNAFTNDDEGPKGSFRFGIRLDHIFGFAEDYQKILYGFSHSLVLVRNSSSNNALFKATAVAHAGEVEFTSISWRLPRVTPNVQARLKLMKKIEDKVTLDVGFRMRQCMRTSTKGVTHYTWRLGVKATPEKPRYIIIAFQTGRDNDQGKNNGIFDTCDLNNAYVLLNSNRYPLLDLDCDFDQNKYDIVYKEAASFVSKYYGIDPLVSSTCLDPIAYKSLYPLYVFDVSKQSEVIASSVVDITIQMFFGTALPENTNIFCLMLSDRKLKFSSDGNKMTVVY